MQLVIDQIADRAFAASAKACEPNHAALVLVERFALFAGNAVIVPMNVNLLVRHGLAVS